MNETEKAPLIAAIDVGTNSFHLIIASVDSRGMLQTILREKEVVRLGASGGDIKYLSEDAIQRGVQTLKRFAEIARSKGAEIRAVATSAVREALNSNQFIELVKKETDIDIEVVSGFEEGRLIYLGTLHSLPIVNQKAIVIDIGGGSTETIIGKDGEILYVHSEKIGAIRLTVRFGLEDEIDEEKVKECRKYIRGVWTPIFNKINQIGYSTLVGTAGTILNIAVMTLMQNGKPVPDVLNGYTLETKDVLKTIKKIISAKNLKERKQIPGMDPQRADIIVGGALILEYALENLEIDKIHISTFGLREGIVYDTLEKRKEIESLKHLGRLRESTIYSIAQNYGVNLKHSNHIKYIALKIFDATRHIHNLGVREREWLEASAILHDVGYLISVEQHHKHSYYIISHCIMPGFTKDEQEIIANIARYHRKSHPKKKHENFQKLPEDKQEIVKKLAGILRIAEGIDRRQVQAVKDIEVVSNGKSVTIKLIPANKDEMPEVELWGAERRKLLFEESMGVQVKFVI
ncbi:MAG: Exopolyphosphatase [Candidatus Kapaibacterium sp.]|nr:MAG: Exopolyphosphatase [Candidatus Kapabacteria bacterium]